MNVIKLPIRTAILSPRECQVAQLVAHGLSNKDIACELSISDGTVKVHVHSIFLKLSIKNRYGLRPYFPVEAGGLVAE